jgi:hypothetical protein
MTRKYILLLTLLCTLHLSGFSASGKPSGDKLPLSVKPYGSGERVPMKFQCADTNSSVVVVEVCEKTYTFHGETYTMDGRYQQVFTNVAGCDSTVYLDLTLKAEKPVMTINVLELGTSIAYETYQWYKNDTAIPGANKRDHQLTPPLPGYYYVVVNEEFCPDTSYYYVIPDEEVRLPEQTFNDVIRIYPNPTSGAVTILAPVPVSVQICSLDGKVLMHKEDPKNIELDLLANGIYFIRITDKKRDFVKVERLVKE